TARRLSSPRRPRSATWAPRARSSARPAPTRSRSRPTDRPDSSPGPRSGTCTGPPEPDAGPGGSTRADPARPRSPGVFEVEQVRGVRELRWELLLPPGLASVVDEPHRGAHPSQVAAHRQGLAAHALLTGRLPGGQVDHRGPRLRADREAALIGPLRAVAVRQAHVPPTRIHLHQAGHLRVDAAQGIERDRLEPL